MNLQFTIAIHALAYLSKHAGESFSSSQLAELICVNPVQLRRVMRVLCDQGLVESKNGKSGGYTATPLTNDVQLSTLFELLRNHDIDPRILTGTPDSSCEISRNMSSITSALVHEEFKILKNYYSQYTIDDILKTIISKEKSHATV
ncbi:RrF2 family transcriptional regulator [Alloscardovia criceti]|uniref:RrF2 family transcriptional regulator n=1 Tax=Alloscardovia criceti TaxID=356828 RepID=UPI00037E992B|nr:Rrf2 family transcriptional regulator [Alloscardovia criceti]